MNGALIRCRFDPRFSYALAASTALPARGLLVTVHNSVRWYRQCLEGFELLCKTEGILPALEPAHAISYLRVLAKRLKPDDIVILNLSGRGDKDMHTVAEKSGIQF